MFIDCVNISNKIDRRFWTKIKLFVLMLIRRVRKNYENEVLSFSMPIYYFVARRPDYHLVCRVAVVVVVTNKPAKISTY